VTRDKEESSSFDVEENKICLWVKGFKSSRVRKNEFELLLFLNSLTLQLINSLTSAFFKMSNFETFELFRRLMDNHCQETA